MEVNGFVFDYDMTSPSSTLAGESGLAINTGKTTIQVADGKLSVDGRYYGTVKVKDRIAVLGGKVSVNGEERTSAREPGAAPDPARR
jgi:phage baseplate assembly protein gpV